MWENALYLAMFAKVIQKFLEPPLYLDPHQKLVRVLPRSVPHPPTKKDFYLCQEYFYSVVLCI